MKTTVFEDGAVTDFAGMLSAMANAKRLHILDIISQKEVAVGQLAEMVDLSQSALSQHLGKLRRAQLVSTRRDAQTIYYSCNSMPAIRLLVTVYEIVGLARHPLTTKISA